MRRALVFRSTDESLAERAEHDHGLAGEARQHGWNQVERYFLDGKIKEIADYVKLMLSTPIAFGCDMSCFAASCPRLHSKRAKRI